jgi:FtsH-binding integral membrane protein
MVQLLITVSFIAWFTYHEDTKVFVQNHLEIMWAGFAAMIVFVITLACCGEVRRKAPMNFIFLFLFTLGGALTMGVVSSISDTDAVCYTSSCSICLHSLREQKKIYDFFYYFFG